MKGNFHVQFLGEGVAATSPPYPTPGWATTQVYPARITPTPDYTDIPSRIYRHDDGPILPTVIPLFVGTAFHWLRKRCCHACLFAKSSVKP